MFGKLICFFKGHKRRVLDLLMSVGEKHHVNLYRCPRCHATWTRKIKAKEGA